MLMCCACVDEANMTSGRRLLSLADFIFENPQHSKMLTDGSVLRWSQETLQMGIHFSCLSTEKIEWKFT